MFSRLFNINAKKDVVKKDVSNDWKEDLDDFQSVPRLPTLDSSKIRVLIFKESSSKKSLMFDSDSIIAIQEKEAPSTPSKQKHGRFQHRLDTSSPFSMPSQKYQVTKPKADVKTLGEMIFGSVAMVYKGSILKVHLIRSPPQLMMTKVFALRSRSAGVNFCDSEFSSISKPMTMSTSVSVPGSPTSSEEIARSFSTPMKPSSKIHSFMNPNHSVSLLAAPSWSTSDLDQMSLPSSFLSMNGSPMDSSASSFRYRFSRSKKTSLDSSVWRSKSEQSEELRSVYKQQPKIGVGIIFNLWESVEDNQSFQNFFFSHYTLFEAQLQAFRVKIEKSFYLRQKFLDTAVEAVEALKDDILRLCYAPRIREPVWINLTATCESSQKQCARKFMNTFQELYDLCENKESSYFLSNLVTAVLTHHLSWVNTVISSEKNSKKCGLNKHTSSTIDVLAKCHPYNPLWAQICDLYGCLGNPFKLARTVIVGKDVRLVNKFLEFLTYFIRCCEVKENSIRMERSKDNLNYRHSGSNFVATADTLSASLNSKDSNVQSWFERNCNIISLQQNTKYSIDKPLDPFKGFKSFNYLNTFDEQDECCVTPRTNERNVIERLESMNIDTSVCYCHVLQALSKISDKSLRSYVNVEDLKNGDRDKNFKNVTSAVKYCAVCRTLEKGICDELCDKCKLEFEKMSVEVDMVCLHCVNRLESMKLKNQDPVSACLCGRASDECQCRDTITKTGICPKKPSFICYCCEASTYGNLHLDLKINTSEGNLTDTDVTPRPRNTSDPLDCKPNNNSKFNTKLRNSTNSHDSGTEIDSVGSCAGDSSTGSCFTRTNSLSSQSGATTEVDSDYCSVESEQLGTTLVDESLTPTTDTDVLVTPIAITDGPITIHGSVSKSLSSDTLKSTPVLESGIEVSEVEVVNTNAEPQNDITKDEEDDNDKMLSADLEHLKLTELPLPKSMHKNQQRLSNKYPTIEDHPSFGKSMFAGYSNDYMADFVLQGCSNVDQTKLANDLLKTVKYSVLDEEVCDAVCIVADIDNWLCEVRGMSKKTDDINQNTSFEPYTNTIYASNIVSNMMESTKDLCSMNMPSNFCLLHIEEQLRDLFNKGKVFAEYLYQSENSESSKAAFMKMFGYHSTDIDLLMAVGDSLQPPPAPIEYTSFTA